MPAERPERANEPIDPAGVTWTRVDEKYITVRYITGVLGWLLTFALVGTRWCSTGWTFSAASRCGSASR